VDGHLLRSERAVGGRFLSCLVYANLGDRDSPPKDSTLRTPMTRKIPSLRMLPDNDCMCPDSVSTVSGRSDLGPDLKRRLLGANAAKLFNLKV
jgi:hypothetical protein